MEDTPIQHTEIPFPNLLESMRSTLATVFGMYVLAHGYHWNVTGSTFAQDHDFFGEVYNDLWSSIDDYAEQIRILGSFAPGSLQRFASLSALPDITGIPTSSSWMYKNLASANKLVLEKLYEATSIADHQDKRGLVNFLEDRITYHDKLGWKLQSFAPAQ